MMVDGYQSGDDPATRRAPEWARFSPFWLLVFVVVWLSLVSARADAWIAGGVAVLFGLLLHTGLGGRSDARLRWRGVFTFIPFFADQMVRGGLDVSRRALSPSLPLDPDLLEYRTRLREGVPRIFFINSISLLPGTFSARVRSDAITVHRLDSDTAPEALLCRLEEKVAELFGVELEEEAGQ